MPYFERRQEAAKALRERSTFERRIADLNGQLDRRMQAMIRGALAIETVEDQYLPIQKERDRMAAELAIVPYDPTIELHPHAATQ